MWITAKALELIDSWRSTAMSLSNELHKVKAEHTQTITENIRLRADLDWFKLRLNAVEKERAQLIQAAIGVKVSIPEFVPVMDSPADAFNQHTMPDLSLIGGDAPDSFNPAQEIGPDYSALPLRTNN